jgi:homoserine/homoserine lactone efflux protein
MSSLLLFAGMTLMVCLAPGPNVMLVIGFALKQGYAPALRAIIGISLINVFYLVLAALGLVALVVASAPLFALVRYCGAAYLIYLGYKLLRAAWAPQSADAAKVSLQSNPLWQGVITHLSNPKGVLYWAALLPQFLDPLHSPTLQITALGTFAVCVDVAVMIGYAVLFSSASRLLRSSRYFRWIEILAGVFFIASGVLLGAQRFDAAATK